MATVLYKDNFLYINFINNPTKEQVFNFQKNLLKILHILK